MASKGLGLASTADDAFSLLVDKGDDVAKMLTGTKVNFPLAPISQEKYNEGIEVIDGLDISDGIVGGKIPVDEFKAIRQTSITNPYTESNSMMLGKFTFGSDSYNKQALITDSSYFDLGDEWGIIKDKFKLTDSDMFEFFNRPALDDAIANNKTIIFSHDPRSYDKGFLVDEWEHIKKILDLTDDNLRKIGDFWYVQ